MDDASVSLRQVSPQLSDEENVREVDDRSVAPNSRAPLLHEIDLAEEDEWRDVASGHRLSQLKRLALPLTAVLGLVVLAYGAQNLLVTGSLTSAALDHTEELTQVPLSACPAGAKCQCLVHVSFGAKYQQLSDLTLPNKMAYANRNGYILKQFVAPDLDGLMQQLPLCVNKQITPSLNYDFQTLLKFCGVLEAMASGCSDVMWTDADSVIFNLDVTIDYWTGAVPGTINANLTTKDAYFALNNKWFKHWCDTAAPNTMETFASCINTGVVIFKNTTWMQSKLWSWLDFSKETVQEKCTTRDLNAVHADQCAFAGRLSFKQHNQKHVGDQCVVACATRMAPLDMQHFASYGANAPLRFQALVGAWMTFPRALFFWNQPKHVDLNTFVVNCAGKLAFAQTRKCVQWLLKKRADLVAAR
jgi:hypothetical protein